MASACTIDFSNMQVAPLLFYDMHVGHVQTEHMLRLVDGHQHICAHVLEERGKVSNNPCLASSIMAGVALLSDGQKLGHVTKEVFFCK